MTENVIEVRGLKNQFGRHVVHDGLDLDLRRGEILGVVGGALMSWIELGISPSMFKYKLIADTNVEHVFVGLSKAPVFALIIGIIGCHAGMKVGKDAESLGAETSSAVVNAIFSVIVADAMFSIFFSEIGI